jgi:AraC family transcriptional regulator
MDETTENLDPVAVYVRVGPQTPLPSRWHSEDHFTVTRLDSTRGLQDRIYKSSAAPALLVSVPLCALPAGAYGLWADGKAIASRDVEAFRSNVLDISAGPGCWAGSAFDFVHFHVPRGPMDDQAADLGYEKVREFRLSVLEEDLVLAQLTKAILPSLDGTGRASVLALDQLELILGAHLLQRYGAVRSPRGIQKADLAAWQRRRATELLRENLNGSVRLAELARQCGLSVTHFCRAFKATFGVTTHQWLVARRIDRAKELLMDTSKPLGDVAVLAGFGDQTAFTKTFRHRLGIPPGAWRREFASPRGRR